MGKEKGDAAEAANAPTPCMCAASQMMWGLIPSPHTLLSPLFLSLIFPPSEVPVLPETVVRAEKGLLGHTVDPSALASFRESC